MERCQYLPEQITELTAHRLERQPAQYEPTQHTRRGRELLALRDVAVLARILQPFRRRLFRLVCALLLCHFAEYERGGRCVQPGVFPWFPRARGIRMILL